MEVQQVQEHKRGPDEPPPKSPRNERDLMLGQKPVRRPPLRQLKMFKLLSINVRDLGDSRKSSSLFQLFEKITSDIIFVQETMACPNETISFLCRLWPGKSFWSSALGRQGGWPSFFLKIAMLKCCLGGGTRTGEFLAFLFNLTIV